MLSSTLEERLEFQLSNLSPSVITRAHAPLEDTRRAATLETGSRKEGGKTTLCDLEKPMPTNYSVTLMHLSTNLLVIDI